MGRKSIYGLISFSILISFSSAQSLEDIFGSNSATVATTVSPLTRDTTSGTCKCVPYYLCTPTNSTVVNGEFDGYGKLDVRFDDEGCTQSVEVCCYETLDTPIDFVPHPERNEGCGIRNDLGTDFQIISDNQYESEIYEFPWVIALLNAADKSFFCAGSLIHPQVVLTGAHCVKTRRTLEVLIRAGEWDTQTEKERIPHQERKVNRFVIHPSFNDKTLANDVALIILESPVVLGDNINPVCLPEQDEDFQRAKNCIATGWGKKNFGKTGRYSVIMKKVTLDAVDYPTCQQQFRNTRLGKKFNLHSTFLCAGGKKGIDTCEGDGGAPLACPSTNNRYKQAGIVAWGIGCGQENVPGAYGYVSKFRNWIDNEMVKAGYGTSTYTIS